MASYEQKNYDDARQEQRAYVRQLVKIVLLGFFYFLGFHGLATLIAFIWIGKIAYRSWKSKRHNRKSAAAQHTDFLMNWN